MPNQSLPGQPYEGSTTEDLKDLLRETEEALGSVAGEKFAALRERLRTTVTHGKASLEKLKDEAKRQAERADELVRTHPYQSIGIAVGLGVLLGIVCARSCNHR